MPSHFAAQSITADVQLLAQAYDRCMATYAVRLSRTETADEDIYAQANQGCAGLGKQLRADLSKQMRPHQASQLFASMDASARPNFMNMLSRIRSDRKQQAAKLP